MLLDYTFIVLELYLDIAGRICVVPPRVCELKIIFAVPYFKYGIGFIYMNERN